MPVISFRSFAQTPQISNYSNTKVFVRTDRSEASFEMTTPALCALCDHSSFGSPSKRDVGLTRQSQFRHSRMPLAGIQLGTPVRGLSRKTMDSR